MEIYGTEYKMDELKYMDDYKITNDITISRTLKQSKPEKINTLELLEHIKSNPILHEFFDAKTQEIRPHFDFDIGYKECQKSMSESDFEIFKVNTFRSIYINMMKIFDTLNFAISEDCRYFSDNEYKISFHFVMINKKINMKNLKIIAGLLEKTELKELGFDKSIYRNGLSKFRPVLCKKEYKSKTFLKPLNFEDNLDFHFVQSIDGLRTFDLESLTIATDNSDNNVSLDNIIEEKNIDYVSEKEDFEPEKMDKLMDYIKKVNNNGNEYFNNESSRINLQMFIIKCYRKKLNKDELMEKMISLIKSISVIRKGETELYFKLQKIVSFVDRYYNSDISINTGSIIYLLKEYKIYDGIKHLFEKLGSDDKCFDFDTFNNIDSDFENNSYEVGDITKSNFLILVNYFERFHFKIINPANFITISENKIESIKSKTEFVTAYEDLYYTIQNDKNNNDKESFDQKPFLSSWLTYTQKRRYNKIDFLPGQNKIVNNNIYNSFNGLRIENIQVPEYEVEDIQEKLDLVYSQFKLLTGDDEECYQYLMNYFAYIFQNLGRVPGVALLFRSEKQGVGKNLAFENFIGQLIGKEYYGLPNSIEDMIGRFTSVLENKIMLINDETSGKESFSGNDKIKKLITANQVDIEHKGVKAYTVKHSAFYVLFSNNDTPIKVEQSDRRFMVFDCDCSKAQDNDYFVKLAAAYKDVRVQKQFYDDLMKKDLSDFNIIKSRPETEFYKSLKESTVPILIHFLNNFLEELDFELIKEHSITSKSLFNKFKTWCSDTNHNNIYTSTKFGKDIKKYLNNKRTRRGIEYNITEQLEEVIKKFIN